NNQILGRFIHHISWSIQFRLNQHLKVIKDELLTLSQKEAEELLINVKSDLILKQRFKKPQTKLLRLTIKIQKALKLMRIN
ncbi:complement regulator-acquiring protein, partial [Escherichia coli]|uniref:complement regulator-acquiring protein n=1 Tax=Escherichia coli TaxID=562 RepID=UPI001BC83267